MQERDKESVFTGELPDNKEVKMPTEGLKPRPPAAPTGRQRRAGRARTRYLSSTGHILRGDELFARTTPVLVMAIQPSELSRLRGMTLQQRAKRFKPEQAWSPTGLKALGDAVEQEDTTAETGLPDLPPLEEEQETDNG